MVNRKPTSKPDLANEDVTVGDLNYELTFRRRTDVF